MGIIQEKFQGELNNLVRDEVIDFGGLFSYIHLIAKRDGLIKIPAEKKRMFSRSLLKEYRSDRSVKEGASQTQRKVVVTQPLKVKTV